ncbi:hypothetical protein JOF56_005703 [Kibdelosporangium banguiense]|uniref:Minor tail protein n=1 Tax=Kibdelosporangium banguiense TaxID=1365924 RepID=A0ABS4TLM8_9PSEU|nr:hypothetical protein [Kibdelosporangium banguiense]MBP2325318.1 hypothetical protein [Kibdelosporangium banguiense]
MLSTGNPALDDALAEALAQPVREPVWRLLVDLGGDGTFSHPWSDLTSLATDIQVDRAITGDLPEGTSLTEGYASASLTARLEGRFLGGTSIIDAVTPHSGNPSWPGVGLRYDLGMRTRMGPVLLRQFTGSIRTTTARASTGAVEITAADGAERLRAAITLPSISLDGLQLARFGDGYRYWMNSQWIVDYVLRANGLLTSAPPMPGAILAVTGHGSLAPEVGFGGQPTGSTGTYTGPLWTDGPDGMLAPNGGGPIPPYTASYTGDGQVTFTVGAGFGMGLWVHHGAGAPLGGGLATAPLVEVQPADQRWVRLTLNPNGGIAVVIHNIIPQDVTVTCPIVLDATVRWRFIGAHLLFSAGTVPTRPTEVTVTWFVDGVTATTRATVNLLGGGEYPSALAVVSVPRPISGVHVWSSATPPNTGEWPRLPTIRPADIEPGLNELTYLPAIAGRDSWDLLKEVAAAEYAVPGFNESGRFSFLNRNTLTTRRAAPPTATLTTSDLAEVTATTSMDSVRNEITISATPAYTRDLSVLIESTDPQSYVVAANGGLTRVVVLPEGSVTLTTGPIRAVTTANWNDTVRSGFVASRVDQPTVEVTSGVAVSVRRLTGTTARIFITNLNAFAIRLATNEATPRPAFRVSGTLVTADPVRTDTVTDATSIARYRRRSLDLATQPWRQRVEPFQALAGTLLDELAQPTAVYDRIPVLGDPRRALTDTVTLTYPTTTKASIVGITRRLSTTDGLVDELTIRPHNPQNPNP